MEHTNPSDFETVENVPKNKNPLNVEFKDSSGKIITGNVINNSDVAHDPEPASIAERLKSIITFFTVEPFLLCYVLPSVISALTVQKLNLEKACITDLGHPRNICEKIIIGDYDENDTVTSNASQLAQVLVADMTAWTQPIQSGIPAIVILFVGAWSDRTGNRKALMFIPVLGELLSAIGMMLTVYFFEWPLWVTGVMQSIPTALSGGLSVALMGSYSYIADVSTVESRTFRIGILGVIVTLGVPIGSALSGILTELLGFYGIFGLDIVFYGFGLIYIYFRIKDVKENPSTKETFCEKFVEFFHPMNAWETFSLVILSRGRQLLQIILILWAHIVIMGPVFGEAPIQFLYMLQKYHMDLIEYSLFTSYFVLMGLAGTTIAITIFSKLLKMHDAILGVIATLCKVLGSLMYAFAPTKTWLYTAPVLDFFGNTGAPAIRSLGTKVVQPDEVGKMCSLIGFIEAIIPVIYVPIYSKVYSLTLSTLPGTFYLIGAIMTTPDFVIFIFLYMAHRRREKDTVKNPEQKEMHAHDNAVTVL
ncbi:proton-coupled folate transporter-like [Epargyreus clarus]|uniref:proton-coupled folate transporter-like n=1 Tax=Epargyreus clarus TaxID=520877 RepID=UPI003C2E4F30